MENSIEEDIKRIECIFEFQNKMSCHYVLETEDGKAIKHILSDYKRALETNEVLLKENEKLHKEIDRMKSLDIYKLVEDWETGQLITKQRIEDIIDRIDYDIKKTKEIISNNSNIYTSDRRNDYQIVRLRAMNTKSLDIKKRLQELLESEE